MKDMYLSYCEYSAVVEHSCDSFQKYSISTHILRPVWFYIYIYILCLSVFVCSLHILFQSYPVAYFSVTLNISWQLTFYCIYSHPVYRIITHCSGLISCPVKPHRGIRMWDSVYFRVQGQMFQLYYSDYTSWLSVFDQNWCPFIWVNVRVSQVPL